MHMFVMLPLYQAPDKAFPRMNNRLCLPSLSLPFS